MNSLFVSAPFVRFDLGRHVVTRDIGLPKVSLGQPQQMAFSLEDYVSDIAKVNDSATRDRLKAKYEECKAKDLTSTEGVTCIAALAADIYVVLKNQGGTSAPAPVLPPPTPPSEFPIVPVALAVLGAGALIYFLAKKGKK